MRSSILIRVVGNSRKARDDLLTHLIQAGGLDRGHRRDRLRRFRWLHPQQLRAAGDERACVGSGGAAALAQITASWFDGLLYKESVEEAGGELKACLRSRQPWSGQGWPGPSWPEGRSLRWRWGGPSGMRSPNYGRRGPGRPPQLCRSVHDDWGRTVARLASGFSPDRLHQPDRSSPRSSSSPGSSSCLAPGSSGHYHDSYPRPSASASTPR